MILLVVVAMCLAVISAIGFGVVWTVERLSHAYADRRPRESRPVRSDVT